MTRYLCRLRRVPHLIILLSLTVFVPGVLAADPADEPDLVIVGDDGEHVSIKVHDSMLTVRNACDGEEEVISLDLAGLGTLLGETLVDVVDTLQETQLDIHVGRDNRIVIADAEESFTLDLDEIIAQASDAIEVACEQLDSGRWTVHSRRDHVSMGDKSDLDRELDEEIQQLEREIQRLRQEIRRIETKRID